MQDARDMQEVKIDRCPICGKRHVFPLRLTKTFCIGLVTVSSLFSEPKTKRYKVVFTCPEKGEKITAEILLTVYEREQIEEIKVGPGRNIENDEG